MVTLYCVSVCEYMINILDSLVENNESETLQISNDSKSTLNELNGKTKKNVK